jgi:hypothetical protein
MADSEQLARLKPNDEVYMKKLGLHGKVARVMPDGNDEPFYEVQIMRFARRDELELIDHEAERKKHRQELDAIVTRVEAARIKVQTMTASGRLDGKTALEYQLAFDERWQAFGHPTMFPKK